MNPINTSCIQTEAARWRQKSQIIILPAIIFHLGYLLSLLLLIPGWFIHIVLSTDPAYTGSWHGFRNFLIWLCLDLIFLHCCKKLVRTGLHLIWAGRTILNSPDTEKPANMPFFAHISGFFLFYYLWCCVRPCIIRLCPYD